MLAWLPPTMSREDDRRRRLAEFPPELRALIDAELAAGNEIVEISSTFPAPPAGACARLERRVTTRPRASGDGLSFYDRNTSIYSGEFADARRLYFVVEPPHPPPPEPDMDAIRAELRARHGVPEEHPPPTPPSPPGGSADRFARSMEIDYEKWHDGIGYDLEVLRAAPPADRAAIERLLLARGTKDWRDVEALAALDTPAAQAALRKALRSPDHEVRTAVHEYAPELVSDAERTDSLVHALERAEFYGGLTQALRQVERFHPPEVVQALLRGLRDRSGEVAVHFAAMLMYLHGKADSAFDMAQRPFFLRFATPDPAVRAQATRELCARIGIAPPR